MSNHMEVFFLVKPAGLFHDSSPGTTFYCTHMRLVLNCDLLLRKHAATTSPPARQNCRLKAMTQKLSDNEWTSSCSTTHTNTTSELKLKLLLLLFLSVVWLYPYVPALNSGRFPSNDLMTFSKNHWPKNPLHSWSHSSNIQNEDK